MAAKFLQPPYQAPPTPPKSIFDPELHLTIQDKHERKVREFQQSLTLLSPRKDEGGYSNNDSARKARTFTLADPKMRIFVSYQEETSPIDIPEGKTVGEVKQMVKEAFCIRASQPARGGVETTQTILCLNYAGAELDDKWVLTDIGIHAGSSLHAYLRNEEQPTLHVYCVHNNDTIHILDKFKPIEMHVSEIRSIASKKSGLPVGVFRLVTSNDRREMFDVNTLDQYEIQQGDTVRLETWDGWSDFINLASRGFTTHALGKISGDELVARYQMKVALYIAAFNGHQDLAVVLLRQGIRSDEPVGEHPYRQWCTNLSRHNDSLKCPIHVAAEAGQFGILRTFVHNNVCCVMAKDGNGLRPLNLALRNKQKSCASFLLTKQWSRINFDNTSIPLSLYAKMKNWSIKGREKALMIHGQEKSTLRRKVQIDGPLVGQGIYLDGFSECIMSSKSKAGQLTDRFRSSSEPAHRIYLREDPEYYFRNIMTQRTRLNKGPKFVNRHRSMKTPDGSQSEAEDSSVRLPSITQEKYRRTSTMSNPGSEFTQKTDDKLPHIKRPVDKIREEAGSPVSVFQDPNDESQTEQKKKKKKQTQPELLLMQAKTAEAAIPLPIHSAETIPKPVFMGGALGRDLASRTMDQYEEYRGMKAKDYAVKCLSIASTFKEKPWLQQVRMALMLTNKSVKKNVKRPQKHQPQLLLDDDNQNSASISVIDDDTPRYDAE